MGKEEGRERHGQKRAKGVTFHYAFKSVYIKYMKFVLITSIKNTKRKNKTARTNLIQKKK